MFVRHRVRDVQPPDRLDGAPSPTVRRRGWRSHRQRPGRWPGQHPAAPM